MDDDSAIMAVDGLSFPFDCESPFLFAVYHLDVYPKGNENMGPDATLSGHRIGADFGNKAGWNMYHGETVPGFPKHPHRGFETITVTRQGLIDHSDSLGNKGRFGDGDVQWMTAGRGINHSEMFPLLNRERENMLELFQIWINLPKKSKMVEPSFKMLWAEDLPKVASGVEALLVAGEYPGLESPPAPPPDSYTSDPGSDVLVITLKLPVGMCWTLAAHPEPGRSKQTLNRNIYFYAGTSCIVGGRQLKNHAKVKLRPDVDVEIQAGKDGPAEALILQGRDIGEEVVQHGPFVMSTKREIAEAFADYQRTGFGGWTFDSDAPVHDRDRPRFATYASGETLERPLLT